MIEVTDSAKFRGKNWKIFGSVPKDLVKAGGNSDTSIEDLTVVEQPVEMLRVPPSDQFKNDTKDFLRLRALNVANRLLYRFDPEDPEWPALQADTKAVYAEVMRRLPPIKTNDVYIEYRTGYEAVCGLNHHSWVDKDYAHDAAIYLMILVEQLPPDKR
jgi:hypothetical protein